MTEKEYLEIDDFLREMTRNDLHPVSCDCWFKLRVALLRFRKSQPDWQPKPIMDYEDFEDEVEFQSDVI